MATQFKLSGGSPTAEAYASAWISSQTDTTATIVVRSYARLVYSNASVQSSGVYARAYGNGSWQGLQRIFGDCYPDKHGGNAWCYTDHYFTVNKGSGQTSAYWASEFHSWVDDTDLGSVVFNDGYVSVPAITYYAPNAPSALNNVYESDNKNILYWTAPSTSATQPVSAILIERSVDGGAWSQIASVSGSATSYNDTTTSADHSYQYRIRSQNSAGYSGYVTSQTTYNTPSAPAKVTASRLAETTVTIALENTARTAQYTELQRSTDGASWESIGQVSGTPVTETTDSPGGGTFYYRARNGRDAQDGGMLWSAWSPASNPVVTICAPAAPTLKAPASGVVVNKAVEQIVFEWLHNAIDGSAQTAAKLRYSLDKGATWVEVAIDGNAASYALENAFAVNSEITWSVCTKGAHEDYGPWSDNRVFYVYQAPSVAFAQPTDGFTVENTPIAIQLQYDDPSGTLASAVLNVSDGSKTVYTRNMATDTECSILAKEWTPDNGVTYTLTVQVRSSSSLSASATREITVDFVLPQPAAVHIENDPETGYASLVVYVEEAEDLEVPKSVSVWRETEDGRVLLGEGLQAGAGVVDKYAPLNADYSYIVTSFADSGAANSQTFANRLDTLWAFMYFANGGIARGKWNPEDSWNMKQEVDYVQYIGREFPVAYMRDSMEETHNVTVTLMDREEMREFRKMMSTHEPVVAKLWDALVFHAVPQVQGKPKSTVRSYWGEVAVSLTRIDGEAL